MSFFLLLVVHIVFSSQIPLVSLQSEHLSFSFLTLNDPDSVEEDWLWLSVECPHFLFV